MYDVVDAYQANSDSDFPQTVAAMAQIPRSQAKTINLGLFYGMGKGKLQAELGVTKDKAAELFNQYHNKVPFVKQLMRKHLIELRIVGKLERYLEDYAGSIYGNPIVLGCIKHCHTKKHSRNMDQESEELILINH